MKLNEKQHNNKIDTKILRGSVYDLRLQDKTLRATFCFYSLDIFTIHETSIYKKIEIDKYGNQI
jgi:hypothetical protein